MFAGVIIGVVLSAVPAGESLAKRDALARYGAAVLQARGDRLVSAAKSLEAAAKLDPDATAPRRELVRVYAQIGREPDAIRVARQVLEKTPADADTAHTLAKLLHDAGDLKDATAAAKLAADSPALADRPDKALAVLRDYATLLEATNDPAAAEDALRRAVTLLTRSRKVLVMSAKFTAKDVDADHAALLERLGKVMVKQAKYEAAAEAYRAAAKLQADEHAAARLNWHLSGVLAAKGDPVAALGHIEAFLKFRPQNLEPYERLAAVLRDAGHGGRVVPKLEQCLAADADNLHLTAVLAAELARAAGTRDRADALFARVLDATNDPKLVRVVVRSHFETGRAGRVLDVVDKGYAGTTGDDPAAAAARQFAADKVKAIADVLRAEPDWADAAARAAHDDLRAGTRRLPQTWNVVGMLAAHHGKLGLAETQFRQAINARQPDTEADAYSGLVRVLWRSRRPAEVARVCEDGLQRKANVSPSWLNANLASALAQLGDADNALAAADKAIAQAAAGDRLFVRQRKGYVFVALGKWDDAAAHYRKLLDEFDAPAERLDLRYALASALWGAKKYEEAETELRAILDADPDHAGACNDLGYHLADQGRNLPEAEKLIRHAIAVDRLDRRKAGDPEPDNAAYLDSLGWVLFRRGDLAGAKEQLEKAAAMPDGATDPTVWDHLGDVLFRLADKAKAKAAWETAAKLYATDARGKRDGRGESVARKLKLAE